MSSTQAKATRHKPTPLTPEQALSMVKLMHTHLIPGSSAADHMLPIYKLLTVALSSPVWVCTYNTDVEQDTLSIALERMLGIYHILDIQLYGKVVK